MGEHDSLIVERDVVGWWGLTVKRPDYPPEHHLWGLGYDGQWIHGLMSWQMQAWQINNNDQSIIVSWDTTFTEITRDERGRVIEMHGTQRSTGTVVYPAHCVRITLPPNLGTFSGTFEAVVEP